MLRCSARRGVQESEILLYRLAEASDSSASDAFSGVMIHMPKALRWSKHCVSMEAHPGSACHPHPIAAVCCMHITLPFRRC